LKENNTIAERRGESYKRGSW